MSIFIKSTKNGKTKLHLNKNIWNNPKKAGFFEGSFFLGKVKLIPLQEELT